MRESFKGSQAAACTYVAIQTQQEIAEVESIDPRYVIRDKCLSYNLSQADILDYPMRSRLQILKPNNMLPMTGRSRCLYNGKCSHVLKQKDVQKALRAQLLGLSPRWEVCSRALQVQYEKFNSEIPTINIVGLLVKSGICVIIYSGNLDSVIPFTGTPSLNFPSHIMGSVFPFTVPTAI
ncbi:Carboxypeptidase [Quillaja saponaria]|uniref:Carboxypeptidase n=1 Tax=Quillaja saponaria TaxID=32244 RepID=A0AAD7VDR9_QUISA|nr:Carboxypeptidase [Quillaja saponaria]